MLMSQKTFEQIRFLGYEISDANIYIILYEKKETSIFLQNRKGSPTLDDLFLTDLRRGGVSPDDPRLQ